MKQVVKEIQGDVVYSEDISWRKYYGVNRCDICGFITRDEYGSGSFRVMCSSSIIGGNNFPSLRSATLLGTVNELLNGKFEVYEFDTPSELFIWLAENAH